MTAVSIGESAIARSLADSGSQRRGRVLEEPGPGEHHVGAVARGPVEPLGVDVRTEGDDSRPPVPRRAPTTTAAA